MYKQLIPVFILNLFLCACASINPFPEIQTREYPSEESRLCSELITHVESAISTHNVVDSQARRIAAYPYLRINRFLSEFRNTRLTDNGFDAWLDQMQKLALNGWSKEINNLPEDPKKKLLDEASEIYHRDTDLHEILYQCSNILRTVDRSDEYYQPRIISDAIIPDEYSEWKRILGIYPLTAIFFKYGINQWHTEMKNTYSILPEKLESRGTLITYERNTDNKKLSKKEVAAILYDTSKDSLAIPYLSKVEKQALLDSFAPVLEIDTTSDDDKIGAVIMNDNSIPVIDTSKPVVYQYLTFTHYNDQVLLQLNYSFWFPSRPKTSIFDMLGGHLDGITWRVTLLPDGTVWLYDAIHNCGCYHMFFPTQRAGIVFSESFFEEPVLIPQVLYNPGNTRPHIRIAHGSHYIERVQYTNVNNPGTTFYNLAEYDDLRSLPVGGNLHKSMFGADGIVESSKRNERFIFWPMGIPSSGAMRQQGHHATAFVGKRHFDDARLLENFFTIMHEEE